MFGISLGEFFVIFVVAILIIPVRKWPDVARVLARLVNMVRNFVWKVTDISENLKQQIELEKPIEELIRTTTDDVLNGISVKLPAKKKSQKPSVKKKVSK